MVVDTFSCDIFFLFIKNKTQRKKFKKVDWDSKIGSSWVSFNLGEVRTIRNKDWDNLFHYFEIPENRKELDFTKIKLKNKSK